MKKNKSIIKKILLATSSLMLSFLPIMIFDSSSFIFFGEEKCPAHLMKEK